MTRSSCAASRASAICFAIPERLFNWNRTTFDAIRQGSPGTENDRPVARLVALPKPKREKKRKVGASNHRFVERTPRKIADAEVAADFENSKLWPST